MATDADANRRRPSSMLARLPAALGTLCLAAGAAILVLPPALASQDLPGHAYAVAVRVDPALAGDLIRPNIPVTGGLWHLLASLVASVAGVEAGVRGAMLIAGAVGATGAALVAREVGASRWLAVSVFAAGWVGWPLVSGFANFWAALAFGLLGTGLLLGATTRRQLTGLLVLLVAVVGHVLGGGIALAMALGAAAFREDDQRLHRLGGIAAAGIVAAALMLLSYRSGQDAVTAETLRATVGLSVADRARAVLGAGFVGYSAVGWIVAPALAVAAMVAPLRGRPAAGMRLVAAGFLVLLLTLPQHGFGLAMAAPRLAFPLALALAWTVRREARAAVIAVCLCALCALASALPAAAYHGARVDDARDAFGPPQPGFVYAVWLDDGERPPAPWLIPMIGVSSYAGGVGSAAFNVNPFRDAAVLTERGRTQHPGGRMFSVGTLASDEARVAQERRLAVETAASARAWDSVVAIGVSETFAQHLAAFGWRRLASARWELVPSTLSLELPPQPEPLVVQISSAVLGPLEQRDLPADTSSLAIERLPAGPVTLVIGRPDGTVLVRAERLLAPGEVATVVVGDRDSAPQP